MASQSPLKYNLKISISKNQMTVKIFNFKKGIGIESEKLWKQDRD